ncbi:uncharacterized protein LOC135483513 [Lineus longissimus]|uniref:uncharacterized protein LOC135483513 n=1 Tax=Lineus longissimus TaxID=88925 RepID=UPI00315C9E91
MRQKTDIIMFRIIFLHRRAVMAYIVFTSALFLFVTLDGSERQKPDVNARIIFFPPALKQARQIDDFVEFVEFSKRNTTLTLSTVSESTRLLLRQEKCHLPDLIYPTMIKTNTSLERVPKIVHLTWKSEKVPAKAVPFIKKWQTTNPDWEVWFWTDKNTAEFMEINFPDYYAVFTSYKSNIERADAMRYFIIYQFGGVYADLDIEPVKSLNPLLDKYTCLLSQEPYEHGNLMRIEMLNNFGFLACNAFMMCRRQHPFFKFALDSLKVHKDNPAGVLHTTGPVFLSKVYRKYIESFIIGLCRDKASRIGVAPAEFFMPKYDTLFNSTVVFACSRFSAFIYGLTYGQKLICDDLYSRRFRNKILKVTFTDHHHFHTWAEGKDLYFEKGFDFNSSNIRAILPKAVVKEFSLQNNSLKT